MAENSVGRLVGRALAGMRVDQKRQSANMSSGKYNVYSRGLLLQAQNEKEA